MDPKEPEVGNEEDLKAKKKLELLSHKNLSKEDKQKLRQEKNAAKKAKKQEAKNKDKPEETKQQSKAKKAKGNQDNHNEKSAKNLQNAKPIAVQRKGRPEFGTEVLSDGSRTLSIEGIMDQYDGEIHPQVISVALKISAGKLNQSNARCAAILSAIIKFVKDYPSSYHLKDPNVTFEDDIHTKIQKISSLLQRCKQFTTGDNKIIKETIQSLSKAITDCSQESSSEEEKVKAVCAKLVTAIQSFAHSKIISASKAVSEETAKQITDGDVVMTHGNSCSVKSALLLAKSNNVRFSLAVVGADNSDVDSISLYNALSELGIQSYFYQLSSLPLLTIKVAKVFVGGEEMNGSGDFRSKLTASAVCEWAKSKAIPSFVCIESYKITNEGFEQFTEKTEAVRKINQEYAQCYCKNELIDSIICESGCISPGAISTLNA